MPEPTMDLTIYDNMETEQLERILREDADATGQVLDPRTLLYITGILAQREQMPSSRSITPPCRSVRATALPNALPLPV